MLLVNVTELSKLTLIGYFLLDLENSIVESAELLLNSEGKEYKFFDTCCSFLMQEELNLSVLNGIRKFLLDDKNLALSVYFILFF
jgi:hypothetical protein